MHGAADRGTWVLECAVTLDVHLTDWMMAERNMLEDLYVEFELA